MKSTAPSTRPARKSIVDSMFYTRSIHLIGVAEGVDVGAIILPWLAGSSEDSNFLGRPSQPFKPFYISLGPCRDEVEEKMEMLGIAPDRIPFITIDELDPVSVSKITAAIPADTDVLVISGLETLNDGEIRSIKRVCGLMDELRALAERRNLCVVGLTGTSDSSTGRERIAGSSLWGRRAGTVIILDPGTKPDAVVASIYGLNAKPVAIQL